MTLDDDNVTAPKSYLDAMVSSAGWCAPPGQAYEFPDIRAVRGGIKFGEKAKRKKSMSKNIMKVSITRTEGDAIETDAAKTTLDIKVISAKDIPLGPIRELANSLGFGVEDATLEAVEEGPEEEPTLADPLSLSRSRMVGLGEAVRITFLSDGTTRDFINDGNGFYSPNVPGRYLSPMRVAYNAPGIIVEDLQRPVF